MSILDQRLEALYRLRPKRTVKADFDAFWHRAQREVDAKPLLGERAAADFPIPAMSVDDVAYRGADGAIVRGTFVRPAFAAGRMPCVVAFVGASFPRTYPERYAQWVLLGYAVFAVEMRGQGHRTELGSARGGSVEPLLDPEANEMRAAAVDGLRALRWLAEQPEIDVSRICVMGEGEGGGLAVRMAALSERVSLLVAENPSGSYLEYAVYESAGQASEVAGLLSRYPEYADRALDALSYFDLINLADRIRVPSLVATGLKDPVCPAETVFALYNYLVCPKTMKVYPLAGHEVPEAQRREEMLFLIERFGIG